MDKQTGLLSRGIAVSIIVLLLTLGFTPMIYAKEEIKEYSLMVPSIFGVKEQKIRLKSKQSNKLDSIFNDLQAQLQNVESVEDTKVLFKRTIDSLVRNNLLSPSDSYFTKKLLFSSIVDRFYSVLNKIFKIETDVENSNCWISGETNHSTFIRPFLRISNTLPNDLLKILFPFRIILDFIYLFSDAHLSSYVFFSDIGFGWHWEQDHGKADGWSSGWVWTENNFGVKRVVGTFRGGLSKIDVFGWTADVYYCFLGVYYFLGIAYDDYRDKGKDYFLGRALSVDINEK